MIRVFCNVHSEEKKVIKLGFNPGPYKEQFEKGVAPYLIKKGYSVEYKDFNDGIQVNNAVSTGEIDGNIMQHPIYLQAINDRLRIDNTGIVQVPTPPMGLYSNKHKKEDKPKDGAWISVPNQPSNEYRAALLLQSIGWIKLKEKIDPAIFSQRDIAENPYHLVGFTLMLESFQIHIPKGYIYFAMFFSMGVEKGIAQMT